MSKAWTLFLPQVQPKTYGAPEVLQVEELRNAAIEFCEKTLAWQQTQIPYPLPTVVINTDPTMSFNNDIGSLVWKILRGELQGYGNSIVLPQTPEWADLNYPGWSQGAQTGKPSNVVQISPDTFAPVPAATGGPWTLILRVALKPSRDSTLGPDFLYNDYYEQIASGAVARLCAMPKQLWTNPQLAEAHGDVFDQAIANARSRAGKGFGRGRTRTKSWFA